MLQFDSSHLWMISICDLLPSVSLTYHYVPRLFLHGYKFLTPQNCRCPFIRHICLTSVQGLQCCAVTYSAMANSKSAFVYCTECFDVNCKSGRVYAVRLVSCHAAMLLIAGPTCCQECQQAAFREFQYNQVKKQAEDI